MITTSQLERLRRIAVDRRRTIDDVLEYFNERAAIREYDGGQLRADAERDAVTDCEAI